MGFHFVSLVCEISTSCRFFAYKAGLKGGGGLEGDETKVASLLIKFLWFVSRLC